jgi:hypothetical protein
MTAKPYRERPIDKATVAFHMQRGCHCCHAPLAAETAILVTCEYVTRDQRQHATVHVPAIVCRTCYLAQRRAELEHSDA